MKSWQVEQLRLVRCSGSSETTFTAIRGEVEKLGFTYCSFGMKGPLPVSAPSAIWISNYPAEWQRRYQEGKYFNFDPTVAHALLSDDLLIWSDEVFACAPEMRASSRKFGLVHGWAQPRRDALGIVSLLSGVRADPPISADELESKRERFQWLSYLCHESMLRQWEPALRTGPEAELSARELEVLRWICEGKTSGDIAEIIGVAESTITFHMRNACQKLGTANRTAAAVRAVLLGLLR